MKYSYDPESNVLAVTIANKPFDYAQEMGDFIVHFDKKDKPVYVEILNASKFIANAATTLPKSEKEEIIHHIQNA